MQKENNNNITSNSDLTDNEDDAISITGIINPKNTQGKGGLRGRPKGCLEKLNKKRKATEEKHALKSKKAKIQKSEE